MADSHAWSTSQFILVGNKKDVRDAAAKLAEYSDCSDLLPSRSSSIRACACVALKTIGDLIPDTEVVRIATKLCDVFLASTRTGNEDDNDAIAALGRAGSSSSPASPTTAGWPIPSPRPTAPTP